MTNPKTKIVDALLFRRVQHGQESATLSVEPDPDDVRQFNVLIETQEGVNKGEAKFESIEQAVEFFDYATWKLVNDKEAMAAFDTQNAKSTFFNLQ